MTIGWILLLCALLCLALLALLPRRRRENPLRQAEVVSRLDNKETEELPVASDGTFSPGQSEREALHRTVEGLLMQGKKIEAIKAYRKQTGFGLREAKEA